MKLNSLTDWKVHIPWFMDGDNFKIIKTVKREDSPKSIRWAVSYGIFTLKTIVRA